MNLLRRLEYVWKHRGQPEIQEAQGESQTASYKKFYFEKSYDQIEVVRRGTDLIVDSAAEIDLDITGQLPFPTQYNGPRQKVKQLLTVLNFRPNPHEDINSYRRQLYMDFTLTGNCFQYWDGRDLFHLPSALVTVHSDDDKKVKYYEYGSEGQKFYPDEIIHTKDNHARSVYVGRSRLFSAHRSISILGSMLEFQEKFFENGAVFGIVLQTPNILGNKIKNKMLSDWMRVYKPNGGAKRPIILDGDMKMNPIGTTKFSELDFEPSVESHEKKILKALGVPPVLLDSGNNANLRPNLQLFYEMTILPIVAKLIGSYEMFFAYDMEPQTHKVRALRPELREATLYYQGLVNTGIMTINEARLELRMEKSTEEHADKLRIPANIAGSAENPTEGGRPEEGSDDDDKKSRE